MTTARRFSAAYSPCDGGWEVTVAKPAVTARGRTLESARIAAVDAIAGHFGVAPSLVVLEDDVRLARPVLRAVEEALAARDAALAAQEASARCHVQAARALAVAGLSMRDSAYLLGLSHSRVQQLLDASRPSRGDRP